jgi:hypothetical protein
MIAVREGKVPESACLVVVGLAIVPGQDLPPRIDPVKNIPDGNHETHELHE